MLSKNACINNCDKLVVTCYDNLLEDYFGYKPVFVPQGITVGEFAKEHPKGVYLVRMEGHISVIMQGKSIDIFDCTDTPLTNAWRVE
ncbi:MAG: hypothetical protein NC131_01155 [Roseburia sp.]|nr:hypothetical protein [Roseburia sp.]